ncbi:MAG: oligosaccharide flippase family protein [Planctomycetota bacterium]
MPDSILTGVVKKLSGAVVLKVLGAAITFISTVLLARTLDKSSYGIFFTCVSLVTIAAILGRIGLDQIILRAAAAGFKIDEKNVAYTDVIRTAYALVIVSSVPVTAMTAACGLLLVAELRDVSAAGFILMLLSSPLISLFNVAAFDLRGRDRAMASIFVQGVLQPLAFLLAILFVLLWGGISLPMTFSAYFIACCVATLLGLSLSLGSHDLAEKGKLPPPQIARGNYEKRVGSDIAVGLVAASWPMWIVAASQLVNQWGPGLCLAALAGPQEVATFYTSSRITLLSHLLLFGITTVVAPMMAKAHEAGDVSGLKRLYYSTVLLGAVCGGIPLLGIFVFAREVMFIFGPEYADGVNSLRILALGQFVNVSTGSISTLLAMCGRVAVVSRWGLAGAIVAVGGGLLMAPQFGIDGVAWSVSLSLIIQNLGSYVSSRKNFAAETNLGGAINDKLTCSS